jgi:hypothetical protein
MTALSLIREKSLDGLRPARYHSLQGGDRIATASVCGPTASIVSGVDGFLASQVYRFSFARESP